MKKLLILTIIIVFSLTSCSLDQGAKQEDGRIKIVSTFAPLYSFTANIAGDKADIYNLLSPGISIHSYEPKPSDIEALSKADILVINGLGLEEFITDMIEAANNSDLIIVDTSVGVKTFETNPHIWLSIENAIIQSTNITKALVSFDNQNATFYKNNEEKYLSQLNDLKAEIALEFAKIEPKQFIVFHDAYSYFLRDFDLLNYQASSIEEFPGKEPSSTYVSELVNLITDKGVNIIFTEPQFSPKLVQVLVDELNVEVYEIDPIGMELSINIYIDNMKALMNVLVLAFAQ